MAPRFAFVTIGQTPRTDLVPEILRYLPEDLEIQEFGALDGVAPGTISEHAPAPHEPRLVTRLRDGSQAVLRKEWVELLLRELLATIDPGGYRAVVLLCTGEFRSLRGPGLFLDAQHLVDHGTAALWSGARRIGVLLPLAEQTEEFHLRPEPDQEIVYGHVSPYSGDRFEEAARELTDVDLIVMHCMGYTEAHREVVARGSGRPVLLARKLVATALANLL